MEEGSDSRRVVIEGGEGTLALSRFSANLVFLLATLHRHFRLFPKGGTQNATRIEVYAGKGIVPVPFLDPGKNSGSSETSSPPSPSSPTSEGGKEYVRSLLLYARRHTVNCRRRMGNLLKKNCRRIVAAVTRTRGVEVEVPTT